MFYSSALPLNGRELRASGIIDLLVSKVLYIRLKKVLNKFVSSSQNAFVEGRRSWMQLWWQTKWQIRERSRVYEEYWQARSWKGL